MQTFMPYESFEETAKALDRQRLNKQILESDQMIKAVQTNNTKFYKGHPCRKMWDNHVLFHMQYRDIMLKEWVRRGYNNNRNFYNVQACTNMPHWYKNKDILKEICKSHRKALLIKDIKYYSKHFPEDIDDVVIKGSQLQGYYKTLKSGKNKGCKKWINPTEVKRKYIKEKNIYKWVE